MLSWRWVSLDILSVYLPRIQHHPKYHQTTETAVENANDSNKETMPGWNLLKAHWDKNYKVSPASSWFWSRCQVENMHVLGDWLVSRSKWSSSPDTERPSSFQTDWPNQSVNSICFHRLLHLSIHRLLLLQHFQFLKGSRMRWKTRYSLGSDHSLVHIQGGRKPVSWPSLIRT